MSSATANPRSEAGSVLGRIRPGFRTWRRTRPFWGGLLAMIAGVPILYFPYAHLTLGGLTLAMSTTAGAGALIIGLLMIALGLTAWFQPIVRIFCGVATTILSLISIPVANLGGFLLGAVTGLIAGGLLCSWAPLKTLPAGPAEDAEADARAEEPHVPQQSQPIEYGAAPQPVHPEEQR
ncbi:DUF6114 domain-containing protein [Kitasatospora sp. NPDC049258]|uniref:DUF6114 domain-containing protein n=1 Tax=Kitasatospora sp. NPDC049258 TaxID=3155394 RepID=UPI003443361B